MRRKNSCVAKIRLKKKKKLSLEEAHVWGIRSLSQVSLATERKISRMTCPALVIRCND